MPARDRVLDLVRYIESGNITDAMQEFYHDDVAMQENKRPPTVGLQANIERERDFSRFISRIHERKAAEIAVDGDFAAIHWVLDYTGADGNRYHLDEVALQTWDGNKVKSERYFYDTAALGDETEPASHGTREPQPPPGAEGTAR